MVCFWKVLYKLSKSLLNMASMHINMHPNNTNNYLNKQKGLENFSLKCYTQGERRYALVGGARMYTIFDIANFFLSKESMTHKKLQKLCYYAVAWGYALMNKPIVSNPRFEAWVHGPVSPDLYQKYRGSGWKELTLESPPPEFDGATLDLLESVWVTYGDQTGNALEALSHSELPWIKARGNCSDDERCDTPLDPEDMKLYYQSIFSGGDA